MTMADLLLLAVIPLCVLIGWGLGVTARERLAGTAEAGDRLNGGAADAIVDGWLADMAAKFPTFVVLYDEYGRAGVVAGALAREFPDPPGRDIKAGRHLFCFGDDRDVALSASPP